MERSAEVTVWLIDVSRQALGVGYLNGRRKALGLPPIERAGGFVDVPAGLAVPLLDLPEDERPVLREKSRAGVRLLHRAAVDPAQPNVVPRTAVCRACGQPFTYQALSSWRTPRRFCDPCKRQRERESNRLANDRRREGRAKGERV
ncbi:MAG: hypothetical protein FJW34_21445 [Acidobacteria bacterium]|nr:hypothetical protein [Acidobacteriota bacterium]